MYIQVKWNESKHIPERGTFGISCSMLGGIHTIYKREGLHSRCEKVDKTHHFLSSYHNHRPKDHSKCFSQAGFAHLSMYCDFMT
jgi:hypothetical protein